METKDGTKIITRTKNLGNAKVFYASEIYDGQPYDTKVKIGQQYIITIDGLNIEHFHNELALIIEKYRI